MSHFVVCVVVPGKNLNSTDEKLEKLIEPLLEPYSENLDVEPYKRKCYCVGRIAKMQVAKKIRFSERMELEREIFAKRGGKDYWSQSEEEREASDAAWKKQIAPLAKEEEDALKNHPLIEKPDESCEECGGTGKDTTTYNPNSKWDWYVIGGRWNGYINGQDPAEDPRNYEKCSICAGTGMRNDKLGKDARAANPAYTCNGCNGKKKTLKWPTQQLPLKNTISVEDFMSFDEATFKERCPYAFVTPDGKWHERGKMGWFGMSSNEMKRDDWRAQVRKLLKKWADHALVVVDCHI